MKYIFIRIQSLATGVYCRTCSLIDFRQLSFPSLIRWNGRAPMDDAQAEPHGKQLQDYNNGNHSLRHYSHAAKGRSWEWNRVVMCINMQYYASPATPCQLQLRGDVTVEVVHSLCLPTAWRVYSMSSPRTVIPSPSSYNQRHSQTKDKERTWQISFVCELVILRYRESSINP